MEAGLGRFNRYDNESFLINYVVNNEFALLLSQKSDTQESSLLQKGDSTAVL